MEPNAAASTTYQQHPVDAKVIIDELWKCGRWQLVVFNLISFLFVCQSCWPIVNYNFMAAPIPFHCRLPANISLNESLPYDKKRSAYAECQMFSNTSASNSLSTNKSRAVQTCDQGYEFLPPNDYMQTSIVSEWSLVCDSAALPETAQLVFMIGVLVGGAVIPTMADRWGRKPVHIISQILGVFIGIGLAFVPNFAGYMILKFFYGFLSEGSSLTGIVWVLELMPNRLRAISGVGFQNYWVVWWCLLDLIAYCVRDWRMLQFITALPPLLSISLIWLAPESITWLCANKRYKELRHILRNHADRFNKTPFPEELLVQLEHSSAAQNQPLIQEAENCNNPELTASIKKYTLLDIAKNRRLTLWTSLLCYLWFQNVSGYYGLGYLATLTAGDKYFTFLLNGLVEIPAYLLGMFLCHNFGRVMPILGHQLIAGTSLIVAGVLPSSMFVLNLLLTLLARYALTFSFAVIIFYTQEIYPTNVRNAGLGFNSAVARIATLICPYANVLSRQAAWMPPFIFGVMALFGGAAAMFLPETRNHPYPEDMAEIDAWSTKSIASQYFWKRRQKTDENKETANSIRLTSEH